MKKTIIFTILFFYFTLSFSQMVIKDSYVYISANTYLVLTKNDPTGLRDIGTSGGIYCQNETAKIKWLVTGSTLGTYTIPYVASNGTRIPLLLNVTSTSSGTNIELNTYETTNSNTPYPSLVNFVTNDAHADNSISVIDRFWQIKFNGYPVAEPKSTVTFTYADLDLVGNTITESNLTMQRYNDVADRWGDWLYSPYSNTGLNTITINLANVQDYYETWTAVDGGNALPIELVYFKINCVGLIMWGTASETNNKYFIIQGSNNASTFTDIDTISGEGNSNSLVYYSYQTENTYQYYRLKQVDNDDNFEYSDIVVGCNEIKAIVLYPNPNEGVFNVNHSSKYHFTIFDVNGKLVFDDLSNKTKFNVTSLTNGTYYFKMENETNEYTFKFIKQ